MFLGTYHNNIDINCFWQGLSLLLTDLLLIKIGFVTNKYNRHVLGCITLYLFYPYCNRIERVSIFDGKDKQNPHYWVIKRWHNQSKILVYWSVPQLKKDFFTWEGYDLLAILQVVSSQFIWIVPTITERFDNRCFPNLPIADYQKFYYFLMFLLSFHYFYK